MTAAIKRISIARGHDIRKHVLVSFGGAGGQHATAIARELGIRTILQHPYAGILSAFGIGMAEIRKFGERHVGKIWDAELEKGLSHLFAEIESELRPQLVREGIVATRILPPRRLLELRYLGQDASLAIDEPESGHFKDAFEEAHLARYGFLFPDRPIEVAVARLELAGKSSPEQFSPCAVDYSKGGTLPRHKHFLSGSMGVHPAFPSRGFTTGNGHSWPCHHPGVAKHDCDRASLEGNDDTDRRLAP